jgi:hypothetical protein
MSIPGFISEGGSLFASPAGARVIPALPSRNGPGGSGCLLDCVDTCTSSGASAIACGKKCHSYCYPRVGTSAGTSPIDRTNCDLCKASNIVWLSACEADITVLGGALLTAVFGPFAAAVTPVVNVLLKLGLGSDACTYVYNQSLTQCPC